MDRKFEQITNGEPLGLPQDLLTDPAKYDADIPLWRRTVGLVRNYGTTRPNKRDTFFDQAISPYIKDPAQLKQLFENLNVMAQLKPEINIGEIKTGLITHAETAVSRRAGLAGWTPKRIEQLISLGLNSSEEFKDVVERMQAALFNAPRTIEEAVDLFYNAAFAMVKTEDPDIREELFSIHCLEKNWLNETAESVLYLEKGYFSADDLHLSRYFAYHNALSEVGKLVEMDSFSVDILTEPYQLLSKRFTSRCERQEQYEERALQTNKRFRDSINQRLSGNSNRYKRLIAHAESPAFEDYERDVPRTSEDISFWEANYRKMGEFRNRPWPENVIKNPDEPLRQLIREHLKILSFRAFWEQKKLAFLQKGYHAVTPRYFQIGEAYFIDILARNYHTPEQKAQVIREINAKFPIHEVMRSDVLGIPQGDSTSVHQEELTKIYTGSIHAYGENAEIVCALLKAMPTEITGKLAVVLEFYRPLLTMEQVGIIEQKIKEIRFDIMTDFRKAVGKRGYHLSIADPVLRQFGYRSLEFKQAGDQIMTIVDIDGQAYQFGIDSDYRIISGKDIKQFQSPQDRAWLELLVLSHLKRLMCTEEEEKELKEGLVAGEKQYETYKKQISARSEHPRRLPPDQRFSSEAYTKCLKGHLPIRDLIELNRLKALIGKGGTLETGLWTYVSGIEWIDSAELKPIRIAFKSATGDLREAINLGQVSDEELSRIENEILGELEKD